MYFYRNASFMTTFQTSYIHCPNCNEKMYAYELTSYLLNNTEVYSDGKVEASNPILLDEILLCVHCESPMWKDDVFVGNDEGIDYDNTKEALHISDLFPLFMEDSEQKTINYFLKILDSDFTDKSIREIYIRMKLWHLLNDKRRSLKSTVPRFFKRLINKISKKKPESRFQDYNLYFKPNLIRLLQIYKPENGEELLLKAEMHREIGDFEQALQCLNNVEGLGNENMFDAIKRAVRRKEYEVFRL